MNSTMTKYKSWNFLMFILFFQIALYITVFFDIPVARQIIGFVYFTFIPGFVFVKLLKLNKFGWEVAILFSVGLGVAFIMASGLIINELLPIFGFNEPLSLVPLIVFLSSFVLATAVLAQLRGDVSNAVERKRVNFHASSLLFLSLIAISIVGTIWVNVYGDNRILIFAIISIAILFTLGVVSKRFLPPKLYPFAVIILAIAILYHSSLISTHIVTFGSDIPFEYLTFRYTQKGSHWISINPFPWDLGYGRYHAMLSITVLPTIYSKIINLDPTWMFKMLNPLIFSFVPLGLYHVWRGYVGKKYAFIASFLLIAQSTFYTEMLGLNRQMIAELFFVLLLLVILNKKITHINKFTCFAVFSFGLVVSHYALAEIFLFFLVLALLFSFAMKRQSINITVLMIILFSALMFIWYIYVSNAAVLESFFQFGNYVYRQLGDFLNIESRGPTILVGLGVEASPSIWNTISRGFAYITQALIIIGFITLVRKRIKNHQLGDEYFAFTLISMSLLFALIVVPGLANTLNMSRFYHILLFFLAPMCVIGGHTLVGFVAKRRRKLLISILLLIVLVPYFLFQTSVVYEITKNDSWSISLSKNRMTPLRLYGDLGYIDMYSIFGAQWLSRNVTYNTTAIYSDRISGLVVLPIYSEINGANVLSNNTVFADNSLIYLGSLNVEHQLIVGDAFIWNSHHLSPLFNSSNLVYNNGRSIIYQSNQNS